jgi:carboxypeptidase Taq
MPEFVISKTTNPATECPATQEEEDVVSETRFDELCEFTRETAMLESIAELLQWDERTYLPTAGGAYRAEQITYMSGQIHRRKTDARVGEWLADLRGSSLAEDSHSESGTTIRQLTREYEKLVKLPARLVEELARATVLGQQAWGEARQNNDFVSFQPRVQKIVDLKREQAEAIGYATVPYDALLDDFEPDESTERVAEVLAGLREELVPLVAAVAESERQAPVEILKRDYPTSKQESFGTQAASRLGFDFQRGRLDVTSHPFCTGLGPDDCRILTRYDEEFFPSGFFSILHEAGHGMYDQGLRSDQYGLPPGQYVSLGIHESQSRLWENMVGRSREFWQHFFPLAQEAFPVSLHNVDLDEFWFAVNDVRPSLIRVEADEATYNLHIVIRFELEQALVQGDLSIPDLPGAWNEKYEDYLGVTPPDDADGVLQDIHWSAGLIGYFPTYSLGNLYAAQLFAAAEEQIGPLGEQFQRGEFGPLLKWLREKIHHPGQCYSAAELVERASGRPLSHQSLLDYLRAKYERLYGI